MKKRKKKKKGLATLANWRGQIDSEAKFIIKIDVIVRNILVSFDSEHTHCQ